MKTKAEREREREGEIKQYDDYGRLDDQQVPRGRRDFSFSGEFPPRISSVLPPPRYTIARRLFHAAVISADVGPT